MALSFQQTKDKERVGGTVGDATTTAGIASLSRYGEKVYGQGQKKTASQTQDIVARRKQRLEGGSPGQSAIRRSRNQRVAMARARGASPAEISQVEGDAERMLVRESFNQEGEALGEYQDLVGNILRGQTSLALGGGALAKAGQAPKQAKRSTGVTVVCTALYNKRDIGHKEYVACVKYGLALMSYNPEFHSAYLALYTPVANAYIKRGWFRSLTRPLLRPWARHMADGNLLGKAVHSLGVVPVFALMLLRRSYGRQLQNSL